MPWRKSNFYDKYSSTRFLPYFDFSPFQLVMAFSCSAKIGELGFHSGCSEVNTKFWKPIYLT